MFDAEQLGGSECVTAHEQPVQGSSRRQYTLKGVEEDTIRLMRVAAQREGMKIGSWVSVRMREAAERALADDDGLPSKASRPSLRHVLSEHRDPSHLLEELISALTERTRVTDEKFSRLEKELHELTRAQRTIMASLLEKDDRARSEV